MEAKPDEVKLGVNPDEVKSLLMVVTPEVTLIHYEIIHKQTLNYFSSYFTKIY